MRAVPVSYVSDPGLGWFKVPNEVVRDVGALDGYSNETRMSLDFTYFNDADYASFKEAASGKGVELIHSLDVQHFEQGAPVRRMGPFNPELISNPLAPGRELQVEGMQAFVNRRDQDQQTGEPILVVEVTGLNGEIQEMGIRGTEVSQVVRPSAKLTRDLTDGFRGPRPGNS